MNDIASRRTVAVPGAGPAGLAAAEHLSDEASSACCVPAPGMASACCGGPPRGREDACCARDEAAKEDGKSGCGCGSSARPERSVTEATCC